MKKILNDPRNYVDEMLPGLIAAHPEYYRLHGDTGKVIARAQRVGKAKSASSRAPASCARTATAAATS